MATIIVKGSIPDMDMGDCWVDNTVAAEAFAVDLRSAWSNDLRELSDAGHDVEINVSVLHNTSGSQDVSVIVIDEDEDEAVEFEMEKRVERMLTDHSTAFTKFCCSTEAESLAA